MKAIPAALLIASLAVGHTATARALSAPQRSRRAPQARPAPPAAPEPARPAAPSPEIRLPAAPAELAQWFPKETTSYVELDDVAGALEASGAAVPLRQLLAWVATEMRSTPGDRASHLDAKELRLVLSSSGAFAEFPGPAPAEGRAPAKPGRGAPAAPGLRAGVLRMQSPQALGKLRAQLVAAIDGRLAKAKSEATVRVGDADVDVLAAEKRPEAPAYAVVGRHFVAGTLASVTAVLAGLARPREQTLFARGDFSSASSRLGERRAVFGLYVMPKSERSDGS